MSAEVIAALAFLAFALGGATMMIAFAVNVFRDGEEMRAANRADRERRAHKTIALIVASPTAPSLTAEEFCEKTGMRLPPQKTTQVIRLDSGKAGV